MLNTKRYVLLILVMSYLSGCSIGRSWDTPSIDDSYKLFPKNNDIHIYVKEYADLVKSAFNYEGSSIFIEELTSNDKIQYPLLTIKIDDPKWSDSFISYSSYLSTFTFSIIPGYTNKYSNIEVSLITESDDGDTHKIEKSYSPTRHYISWLPLVLYPNYGSDMANSWGTLKMSSSDWNEAYKFYIREFLQENLNTIEITKPIN